MTHLLRSSQALPPVARAGLIALLAAGCGMASATEYGTVMRVTPDTLTAASTRECWQQRQLVQQPTTGGGAAAGAVVGGVLGHGLGGGPAGTVIGALIGAGVGNNAEAASTPPAVVDTTRCRRVSSAPAQPLYDVLYEFNGEQYSVKMSSNPGVGARIPLDIVAADALAGSSAAAATNVPAPASNAGGASGTAPAPDVATAPVAPPATTTYVYPAYPTYPVYAYPYPYGYVYPSVTVGIAPRVWIGGRWGWRIR